MEEKTKLRNTPKVKDRRHIYDQNEIQSKRTTHQQNLLNTDLSQLLPPQPYNGSLPVGQVISETNKLIKYGMEKELALLEKDTTIQNSNETIENLRKNIFQLQMEYENLDQNYQKEISYRSEIVKRMDITRGIVESAVQYSAVLTASVKQLEIDKLKIAEFYELIYQGQKEVEEKHNNLEKVLKEQDNVLKDKLEAMRMDQEKALSLQKEAQFQLSKELCYTNDKLKMTSDENANLLSQVKEFKQTICNLEEKLAEQDKQNWSREEIINNVRSMLKNVQSQKIKYQRMWKHKNVELKNLKRKKKNLIKDLTKAQDLLKKFLTKNKVLEKEKEEIICQLELEANRLNNWERQKEELRNEINGKDAEIDELRRTKFDLNEKVLKLKDSERTSDLEYQQLQQKCSEVLRENKNLKETITDLEREDDRKSKVIIDLEAKVEDYGSRLNSGAAFRGKELEKYQALVKELEGRIQEMQENISQERSQKDKLVTEYNSKIEQNVKLLTEKIKNLEKEVEFRSIQINKLQDEVQEKTNYIKDLKSELENVTPTLSNNEKCLEVLKRENEQQKLQNVERNKILEQLKQTNEVLSRELNLSKIQFSDCEKQLNTERGSNKTLEKNVINLKKEIEREKKSVEILKQKNKDSENKLSELQTVKEENSSLKASVADLKSSLEQIEARVEAYKVVVKKLETEKLETRGKELEEVSNLKLELKRIQEARKKDEDFFKLQMETLKENFSVQMQSKRERDRVEIKKAREKPTEPTTPLNMNAKENKQVVDEEQSHGPTTPLQSNRKFLSTPRKVLSSTPQTRVRNIMNVTPTKKKRDPYEFDSDSSVERYDSDQVLKVFSSLEKKKEISKRPKRNS